MPRTKIQTYPDGVLRIYRVRPETPYGQVAESDMDIIAEMVRFANRKVGMSRFWTGWSAGERIDQLVRIPLMRGVAVETGNVVRLFGAVGDQDVFYTVLQAQTDLEGGFCDLSLGVMGVDQR